MWAELDITQMVCHNCFMSNQEFTGTVFYASTEAQRSRHYKEGRTINTADYFRSVVLEDDFVQIDFDSSGRNYVHVALVTAQLDNTQEAVA